jgi:hypothetical protein
MESMKDKLSNLVAAIGPKADFAAVVEFEAGSTWAVALDEKTRIDLSYDENREVIVLDADLGVPSDVWSAEFNALALRYGWMWRETDGTAIVIDPEDGSAAAICAIAVSVLTEDLLIAAIAAFAERVAGWREMVLGQKADRTDALSEFGSETMMRV